MRPIEKILKQYLPEEGGAAARLAEAMNYSVMGGGKRVRPRLMYETYRLLGGMEDAIEPLMAAMEMLHSASLVHDDLPCMDNDDLRRGRPTTWKAYGEAMGVLAGDGLIILAFETAARSVTMTKYPQRAARCLGLFAHKAGICGMMGGQTVDVEMTGMALERELLEYIDDKKTGALIVASMMIGAIMAGATTAQEEAVESAAKDIGRAFQIKDDILDVTATTDELGKPAGSDEENSKTTWVTLVGSKEAATLVDALSKRALETMRGLGDAEFFEGFIGKLADRKY